jgi:hypothetical protein
VVTEDTPLVFGMLTSFAPVSEAKSARVELLGRNRNSAADPICIGVYAKP